MKNKIAYIAFILLFGIPSISKGIEDSRALIERQKYIGDKINSHIRGLHSAYPSDLLNSPTNNPKKKLWFWYKIVTRGADSRALTPHYFDQFYYNVSETIDPVIGKELAKFKREYERLGMVTELGNFEKRRRLSVKLRAYAQKQYEIIKTDRHNQNIASTIHHAAQIAIKLDECKDKMRQLLGIVNEMRALNKLEKAKNLIKKNENFLDACDALLKR